MNATEIGNHNRVLLAQSLLADYPENMSSEQRFARGEALFVEGELATSSFIVRQGTVHLVVGAGEDAGIVVSEAGAGEMVGICAAFSGEHYSLTALAESEVRAIRVPNDRLMHLIEARPELRLAVLKTLSENVQRVMRSSARIREGSRRRSCIKPD